MGSYKFESSLKVLILELAPLTWFGPVSVHGDIKLASLWCSSRFHFVADLNLGGS